MDYFEEFGQNFDEDFVNYLKEQASFYEPELDSDFEINQENYAKVIVITSILKKISDPDFAYIYPVELIPRQKNVSVEVDYDGFTLKGEYVSHFKTIIELSDMIDFNVMNGKLHFEFVVKSVFEKAN